MNVDNLSSALLALIAFAFADYVGFYYAGRGDWMRLYRILQGCLQVSLTALLWVFVSGYAALVFNIWWWFWIADLIYYLLFDSLRWYHRPYAGDAFAREVLGGLVRWAWWTPYGLLSRILIPLVRTGKIDKLRPISGDILLVQAWVGTVLGLALALR